MNTSVLRKSCWFCDGQFCGNLEDFRGEPESEWEANGNWYKWILFFHAGLGRLMEEISWFFRQDECRRVNLFGFKQNITLAFHGKLLLKVEKNWIGRWLRGQLQAAVNKIQFSGWIEINDFVP